jgi:tripartite-type tricarboxylate transporter receptor subunit TctC
LVVLPLIREDKLRVLAVTSKARRPNSTVPTMAESGFPGFDVTAWIGLMAPAGTSRAIVDKVHRETVKILTHPDMRKRLDQRGTEVIANSPAEFTALIRAEIPQWAKVIREAGISQRD